MQFARTCEERKCSLAGRRSSRRASEDYRAKFIRGEKGEFAGTCQSSRLAASYITEFVFSLSARERERRRESSHENGSNDGSCEILLHNANDVHRTRCRHGLKSSAILLIFSRGETLSSICYCLYFPARCPKDICAFRCNAEERARKESPIWTYT